MRTQHPFRNKVSRQHLSKGIASALAGLESDAEIEFVFAGRLPVPGMGEHMLQLLRAIGCPMEGLLSVGIRHNLPVLVRFAMEELGQSVDLDTLQNFLFDRGLFNAHVDIIRLMVEHAGDDVDDTVRDGMLRVADWRGQSGREREMEQIASLITEIVMMQKHIREHPNHREMWLSNIRDARRQYNEYILSGFKGRHFFTRHEYAPP